LDNCLEKKVSLNFFLGAPKIQMFTVAIFYQSFSLMGICYVTLVPCFTLSTAVVKMEPALLHCCFWWMNIQNFE
jgi:hypothetical protein